LESFLNILGYLYGKWKTLLSPIPNEFNVKESNWN
jgi:hypothetical protein